ncbi:hypothetical protein SmJEL517_g05154 [Synchytrium microbalum]|uniref:Ceramide glucosyltransferase n=1 Tax=Synchytrium microbalum TaxID=1806994 RepID=A0A507C0P2_9FUNG|nr:uncharacterized protein SmJEL517_g05154 [Synchytrium microbalum]TPX31536.1 hypothetical protein SmJEL517_g05154 [Synchytrium microbalum]
MVDAATALQNGVAGFSVVMWIVMTQFCLWGAILVRIRYSHPPTPTSSQKSSTPSVTILRPMKGVDNLLEENLASAFKQEYPKFEVIMTVADPKDKAVEVARMVMKAHPNVDARIVTGNPDEAEIGPNPKVCNLLPGYHAAKYNIIWIVDSNVLVAPDCMGRSVDALHLPNIGLVHHAPVATRPQSFGSRVEMMFLNTAHCKMYLSINYASISSCINGKSNMFRKTDLERAAAGGLAHFARYLSEDNIMGEKIWQLGLRHATTADFAMQPLGALSLVEYFRRRSRWIRIRKYVVTVATLIEPFTESIVCGLLGVWGWSYFLGWTRSQCIMFLVMHFIGWIASDTVIAFTIDDSLAKSADVYFLAWIVREVMALPIWCIAMAGYIVEWRGKPFRLNPDGTATAIVTHWHEKKQ